MQNWNQWQLPAGPVTAPMPQPPIGYAAPGADPMATMQAYLQYYNQPAPSGYTAEQWSAAQQQNWAQWQTWQQQYQQWQAQYGEKYQETMKQMSSQGLTSIAPIPASMNVQPPPLPKEDSSSKPPLPPDNSAFGFSGIPPPHQNNLPLFPSRQSENPPLPPGQPPLPPDNSRTNVDNNPSGKRLASSNVDTVSAKKMKVEDEELTEAEKTFDAQFKQWEEQFNKWKQQNANHPDKTQYKQYEAKWTSWREKLIERREQMRRKREQQKQAAAKAEAEKDKSTVRDDKILNSILTSTENQGLINNLLGIGKTLGLIGKNEVPAPPPGQPPVATMPQPPVVQATAMGAPTMTPNMNQAAWAAQQWAAQYNTGMNMNSYSTGFQQPTAILPPPITAQPPPMTMPNFNQPPTNFNQPPPGMLGAASNFPTAPPNIPTVAPNFSLPPPGFGASNNRQQMDPVQDQRSGPGNSQDSSMRSFRPDGDQRQGQSAARDSMGSGNDRFEGNRFNAPPPNPNDLGGSNRGGQFTSNESYGRDGSNKDFSTGNQFGLDSDKNRRDDSGRDFSPSGRTGNEFRSGDRFCNDGDRFGSGFDREQGGNRFGRDGDNQDNRGDDRSGGNRDNFNSDRFGSNNDRSGPGNDRFGSGNDRFSSENDRFDSGNKRFGSENDRFSSNNDRFGSNNDRFGSNNDRFDSNNDRFGSNNDRFNSSNDQFKSDVDRFGSSNDRFRPSCDQFGPTSDDRFGSSSNRPGQSNDKFSRPPPDRFDLRDNSRDSVGSNSRSFSKTGGFDPPSDMPPELQKLMAKRKAAMDVFKPSSFGSFLNSDTNISTSPSLSESFRKITGDSPFLSRSLTDFGKKDNSGTRGSLMGSLGSGDSGKFDSFRDISSGDGPNFKFRGPGNFRPQGPADFRSRGDFGPRGNEFGPRNSGEFDFGPRGNESGPRDSGDFGPRGNESGPRDSGDFGPRGNESGPRDSGDFGPRGNESGSRDSGNFGPRGNEFGPRGPDNFGSRGNDFPPRGPNVPGDDNRRLGDFGPHISNEFAPRIGNETSPKNEPKVGGFEPSDKRTSTPENIDRMLGPPMRESPPQHSTEEGKGTTENSKEPAGDSNKNNEEVQQEVPPLQMPPWMSSDFADDDIIEVPINEPDKTIPDSSKDKSQPPVTGDSSQAQEKDSEVTSVGATEQKSDALPFMGENDPKPEDLNMEPPPELPNLGPIKEVEPVSEQRGPNLSDTFNRPPVNCDQQMNFDPQFGPPGMQTNPKGPMPFGPRGPNGSQLPPFGPRGMPDIGPSMRPTGGTFGPHCSIDRPFGPRGSQDGSFGPRGSQNDSFGPRGSQNDSFGPRGSQNDSFGPRGPQNDSFGPRGPQNDSFGPRGPQNDSFGPRGPQNDSFGPRGSQNDSFGPRGPQNDSFGPRGPQNDSFGPRGSQNDSFGPRGSQNDSFGPRGSQNDSFGPRNLQNDSFGPREPSTMGPFGPRGPGNFGACGPSNFGPGGPSGFIPRGPVPFGSGGPGNFGPRGPLDFGPRDPIDRPFGPRGVGPFGPPGPLNRPFPGVSNDAPFGQKPPFASSTFAPQGNLDKPGGGIPSLMSFKFDRPIGPPTEALVQNKDESEGDRSDNLPPAFRGGDMDQRPFGGDEPREDRDTEQGPGSNMPRGADWRQSFGRNKFGDSDQRSGPVNVDPPPVTPGDKMEIGPGDKIDMGPGDKKEIGPGDNMEIGPGDKIDIGPGDKMDHDRMLSERGDKDKDPPCFGPDQTQEGNKNIKSVPRFDENSGGPIDKDRISGSNFTNRRLDDRSGRNDHQKEFCIEKQFNYNHSGGKPDEISAEITPANVIDYSHASRVIVHDYVTPSQCFDYGHGNLKPVVADHEVYPRKDFRNWVENEQNLREYTDRMRIYESDMRSLRRGPNVDLHLEPPHLPFRDRNRIPEDRRSFERDRRPTSGFRNDRSRRDRDSDDHRERDRRRASRERGRIERDREYERSSNKHREERSQHRRSNSKDRTRERSEKIRKETNKENKKDDERSKGNVSGQESSAKKPTESTSPDNSKLESNDGETEEPAKIEEASKIVEASKTVEATKIVELPTTMELPKTPNFTMVDDLLCQPGRQNRPPKIVVILRGPPGSGKSFVAKLIKDKETDQGGSAPRILSLDDYFLTEKEIETEDDNGKKITTKEMVYEYEEAMESSYITSLIKAFKKNITDGFFNFIILDSINEKISDYEEMWSFAKTKGFRVYVCEMEMDVQICLKRNIHNRTEDEVNRIVDYFEPTPSHHQKLDVTSMLQEEAIEEVQMEDTQEVQAEPGNDDSQDSQEDPKDSVGVSKWERMEAEDKLDRLDGLAKRKSEGKTQTMEDFLQVPDYYNMEDTSGKRRVRWADLEERKEQEKMRAVGFVVGQTNWDRMMDPTKGGSALTRTKYI